MKDAMRKYGGVLAIALMLGVALGMGGCCSQLKDQNERMGVALYQNAEANHALVVQLEAEAPDLSPQARAYVSALKAGTEGQMTTAKVLGGAKNFPSPAAPVPPKRE